MTTSDTRVDDLKGRHVLDKAGFDLGEVEDVTLDSRDWRVSGLIVKVSREASERLRLGRPLLGSARIEVGTSRVESIADAVLLNVEGRDIAALLYPSDAP